MQERVIVYEEMVTDVPLPATNFIHLPKELRIKILEQVILNKIKSVAFSTEWDVLSPTHELIYQLGTLGRACKGILYDISANGRIAHALDKKSHSGDICTFMGTKVSPQWRFFSLAERLGTKGALLWIMQQPQFEIFFAQLKAYAMTTDQQYFQSKINKFVVKVCGGYSISDYAGCKAIKVEDEYPNDLDRCFKEQGIPVLKLGWRAIKTLEGLQTANDIEAAIKLKLSGNYLSYLEPNAFQQLKNLIEIAISDNRLSLVNFEVFSTLKELREIDLSHNVIKEIECSQLLDCPKLSHVCLSHNKIEVLDLQTIANIGSQAFDVYNNPLQRIKGHPENIEKKPIKVYLNSHRLDEFRQCSIPDAIEIR